MCFDNSSKPEGSEENAELGEGRVGGVQGQVVDCQKTYSGGGMKGLQFCDRVSREDSKCVKDWKLTTKKRETTRRNEVRFREQDNSELDRSREESVANRMPSKEWEWKDQRMDKKTHP